MDKEVRRRSMLIEARRSHNLSQLELAIKLHTTESSVSKWECGSVQPGIRVREQLCEFFGKTEQDLDITDNRALLIEMSRPPSNKLWEARLRQDWDQFTVAKRLGVSTITFGRWERGETAPSKYAREKLCEIFHKSAEELGLTDYPVSLTINDFDLLSAVTGFVGERLKALRVNHKLSQRNLAIKIDVSERTVARWEHNEVFPSLIYQQRLCELFGVDAEDFGFIEDQVELIDVDQPSRDDGVMPNNLLSRQRKLRGWTQRDVAEKISTYVVNVSRWERGETIPDEAFQQKLCELFQKTGEELGFSGL